jgi:hypothetical protein
MSVVGSSAAVGDAETGCSEEVRVGVAVGEVVSLSCENPVPIRRIISHPVIESVSKATEKKIFRGIAILRGTGNIIT